METGIFPNSTERYRITGLVLALLGAVIMGYLTLLHYGGVSSSICDFSSKISCDVVNRSIYSELLRVPLAVLGLCYFLALIVLFAVKTSAQTRRLIMAASMFSLIFGLYLSFIEWAVIGVICLFCETSKVIMAAVIFLTCREMKKSGETFPTLWLAYSVVLGLAASAAAYLLQS